jgi:hypothetical protein
MDAILNLAAARLRLAARSTLARPGMLAGNEIPEMKEIQLMSRDSPICGRDGN